LGPKLCTGNHYPYTISDQKWQYHINCMGNRGIPVGNIKLHPNCQPNLPQSDISQHAENQGSKVFGALIGYDSNTEKQFQNEKHESS
jgi:hypothetical protein